MNDVVLIDCMYSCTLCGIVKAHVNVRARELENVLEWTENVLTPALVKDHDRRSPHCHPKSFSEVYIPMTGAKMVGGPCEQ
jgi:hypothetical protein